MASDEWHMIIQPLVDAIKEDYAKFSAGGPHQAMVDAFNASIRLDEGRKYVKVVCGGSAWGFIVKDDSEDFKAGDILKAASWNLPAKNCARGNVITKDFSWVKWTGPAYLK